MITRWSRLAGTSSVCVVVVVINHLIYSVHICLRCTARHYGTTARFLLHNTHTSS